MAENESKRGIYICLMKSDKVMIQLKEFEHRRTEFMKKFFQSADTVVGGSQTRLRRFDEDDGNKA